MLIDIIQVKPLANKTLYIKFEDGLDGNVDLKTFIKFTGLFKALNDTEYFNKVALNTETGTIYWPNQSDICSDVLYSKISELSIEELLKRKVTY